MTELRTVKVLAWGVCACNIVGALVAKVGTSTGLGTEPPFVGHPVNGLAVTFGKVSKLLDSTDAWKLISSSTSTQS